MGSIKQKNRARRRKKQVQQHRRSMLGISAVILLLAVIVSVSSIELRAKNSAYIEQEQELEKDIQAEKDRAEEIEKRRVLESRLADRRAALDIDGLIARFKDRPTDFEPFCAELFRTLGWQAQTTPPVRDGGFDLRLRRSDGTTYIAECKCYDRRHHVGRPWVAC